MSTITNEDDVNLATIDVNLLTSAIADARKEQFPNVYTHTDEAMITMDKSFIQSGVMFKNRADKDLILSRKRTLEYISNNFFWARRIITREQYIILRNGITLLD